jgi:hypothetical protein
MDASRVLEAPGLAAFLLVGLLILLWSWWGLELLRFGWGLWLLWWSNGFDYGVLLGLISRSES